MSYECTECGRDLRGGHDLNCSRYVPPRQTDADDITELGALSADKRDQLADDLRREQDLEQEREHLTDGSPCWCGPAIEDYRSGTVDPDAVVPGIDATTGISLHTPIVEPAPSTKKVQFGDRLRARRTLWQMKSIDGTLDEIADEIDQDAADLRNATQGL